MGSKVPQPSPNVGPPQSTTPGGDQVHNGQSGPAPGETSQRPGPVPPPPPPKKD